MIPCLGYPWWMSVCCKPKEEKCPLDEEKEKKIV